MNTESLAWTLGLLGAAGLVVGGVALVTKTTAAAAPPPTTSPPPQNPGVTNPQQPPGVVQSAQVVLSPGTMTATVGMNQSLTFIAPTGTITSVQRPGFLSSAVPNASAYSVSDFTQAGAYTYSILWTDSSGTSQTTTVQVTVPASPAPPYNPGGTPTGIVSKRTLQPGTMIATMLSGSSLELDAPTGGTITRIAGTRPEAVNGPIYTLANLTTMHATYSVSWTDASGAKQTTSLQVNVQ